MIPILRLLAACGLAALMLVASWRLERRLDGGAAAVSGAPADAAPALEARAPAPRPAGAFELRVFGPGAAEHRGPLRVRLIGPLGQRLDVAFAHAPYACAGLEPGAWRLSCAGPVLPGRALAFALEPHGRPRLDLTVHSPLLEELGPLPQKPWPLTGGDAAPTAEPEPAPAAADPRTAPATPDSGAQRVSELSPIELPSSR